MRKALVWTIVALLCCGIIILTDHRGMLQLEVSLAQPLRTTDLWQQVYQRLPSLPLENQYISRETGQVALDNTLVKRMIQYHLFQKGRPAALRFDWKLTIADYLGANEYMDEDQYSGATLLRQNPMAGDQAAIRRLTRSQRDALVQVLVDVMKTSR